MRTHLFLDVYIGIVVEGFGKFTLAFLYWPSWAICLRCLCHLESQLVRCVFAFFGVTPLSRTFVKILHSAEEPYA